MLGVVVVGLAALVLANLVGYQSLIVRSGSMGDSIPVGSLVLTEPVPKQNIRVGDVAVVAPAGPSSSRLHRVIEVRNDGDEVIVVTQGDANPAPDSDATTLSPQVQVRATSVPLVGYALDSAGSRIGLLALATLAAAVIGWWGLRVLWRPAAGPSTAAAVDNETARPATGPGANATIRSSTGGRLNYAEGPTDGEPRMKGVR